MRKSWTNDRVRGRVRVRVRGRGVTRLLEPDERSGQMQEAEIVASKLLEAHRDAAQSLDALEEVLDKTPLSIEMSVEITLRRARRIGWDDRRASVCGEQVDERSGVVCAIARDVGVLDVAEQFVGELHLVCLARRQRELHWITERVNDGVDLRGRTSA